MTTVKATLTTYRRHLAACPHRSKGQSFTLCDCPIWAYGKLHGVPFRKALDTTNAARAQRRIEILQRGEELAPEGPNGPTVEVAVKAFLEACRGRNLRKSTLTSYRGTLAHLAAGPRGKLAMRTIDAPYLDAYRKTRVIGPSTWRKDTEERTIGPGTWRKELETLRAFFAWSLDRDWIADNPAKRLRMPRVQELATAPFTPDEVRRLLEACRQIACGYEPQNPYIQKRARALVLVLLYSGLRISDVAQLRRAALDSDSGHLTLRVLKNGVSLKVLLHETARVALEALPSADPRYFFWTGSSDLETCIKSLRRTVQRLGAIAKVHAHPHRFRDTFATELLTNGADIRTVQKLLGHTSVRTTEKHYAHFVAAHQALLDSAAATLDFERKAGRPLPVKPLQKRLRNAK